MPGDGVGSVSVEVVPDAENFWRRFAAETRAGATESGRRAGEDWSRGFRVGAGEPVIRPRVDTSAAKRDAQGLLGAILPLAPALVPLAAAAGLAGATLVSMGATGVLAVKGISRDMKAANADGLRFSAGLNVLKTDLAGLEQTAAHGVLGSFQQAAARLHATMPAVNADLVQSSKVLGDIAGHGVDALVGGLHTFAPALLQIEQGVDRVAARFDAWATGPGGARFAQALINDFQHVEPLVENLTTAIGRLIAGANGPGLAIVDELNVFAGVLARLPVPVMDALITSIVSLRVASTVAGLMDRLALSIQGVAVAEGEAGVASGRFRGGLAATVGFLGKAAAGWLAVSIAAGAAHDATQGWESSSNSVQRFIGTFTTALNDLGHFNLTRFGSDLFGANSDKAAKAAGYVKTLNIALDDMWKSMGRRQSPTILDLKHQTVGPIGSVAGDHTSPTVSMQIWKQYQATIDQTTQAIHRHQQALATLAGHVGGSQLETAYGKSAAALQKNITQTEKFIHLGGEQVGSYKGVALTAGMYQVALQQTGGNLEKATGFIRAQIDSLGQQRTALGQTTTEQQRLGTYLSDVATKYKLSSTEVDVYSQALGINLDRVAHSTDAARAAEQQFGAFIGVLRNGDDALNGWIAAVDQWSKSTDTAADRAQLIGAALRAANGDMLGYSNTMVQAAVANQQLVTDFANVKKGVLDLKKGTIDYHNAAAAPLLNDLQGLQTAAMNAAAATYQHENALGKASSASDAFAVYTNDTRGALIKQAGQLGLTKTEARKLADQYFGIKNSGDLKKQIALIGQDKVLTALQGILKDLDLLAGKRVDTYVYTHYEQIGGSKIGSGTKGNDPRLKAAGGFISGPGTSMSDSIPAWLSNGEFVVNAKQTAKHRGLLHALNEGIQGFSGGGETGGFTGVDSSGNANKYGHVKGSSGGSSSSTKKDQGPPKFDAGALSGFLQQIGIATNAFTQAENALVAALRDAKVSHRQIAAVARMADRLIAYSERLTTETARVDKARSYLSNVRQQSSQERSSVRSAFMSLFDLSNAGVRQAPQQIFRDVPVGKAPPVSGALILADLTTSANRAVKTRHELKGLENSAKGNPSLAAFVQSLAENPQADQAQIDALTHASRKTLTSISKQFGRLGGAAGGAGGDLSSLLFGDKIRTGEALLNGFDPKKNPALARAVRHLSDSLFGAGKETARGLARGLIAEKHTLTRAMHELAREMEATIRKDLKMRSPSRTFHEHGRNVVAGLVNGIVESLPDARSAAGRLAGSLDPGKHHGRFAGRGDQWHFHGLQDPVSIGTAVARRQRMLAGAL